MSPAETAAGGVTSERADALIVAFGTATYQLNASVASILKRDAARRDLASYIAGLEAEAAALRAEVDRLRATAEPIAAAARHYASAHRADLVMARRAYIAGPRYPAPRVTVEHLDALAAALRPAGETGAEPVPAAPGARAAAGGNTP